MKRTRILWWECKSGCGRRFPAPADVARPTCACGCCDVQPFDMEADVAMSARAYQMGVAHGKLSRAARQIADAAKWEESSSSTRTPVNSRGGSA